MIRPLVPVIGAVLLCAQSFAVFADTATSASSQTASTAQIRQQVEAKRDQLSGVSRISSASQKTSSTLLDTPVATDDAPAQAQQP